MIDLGAEVEVVADVKDGHDLARPEAIQSLIDAALDRFGGFSSAFVRPAVRHRCWMANPVL
jgi:hypothetical protein